MSLSDEMTIFLLVSIGAIAGLIVGRIAGGLLPAWGMFAFLIVYCVLLLDIAVPHSFLGLTYWRGPSGWEGLGEALLVLFSGVPSVIAFLSGWAWASAKN